jgi:hypothetical protein
MVRKEAVKKLLISMSVLLTVVSSVILFSSTCNAGLIQYATGTTGGTWDYPGGGNIGTEFLVNTNFSVTSLGIFDDNGLTESHTIGLFTSSGTLLASVTIAPGGTKGQYDWVNLAAPILLSANTSYVLSAQYSTGNDYFLDTATIGSPFTVEKQLTQDGPTFQFPTDVFNGSGNGWFGPNLSGNTVPEPSTLLLMGMGLGGLLTLRKKFKTA